MTLCQTVFFYGVTSRVSHGLIISYLPLSLFLNKQHVEHVERNRLERERERERERANNNKNSFRT